MGFVALTKTVKDYNGHFILVYYRPQRSCGKVMFSQASVILFTGEGVYPSMHWGRHPPWTDTPRQTPPWIDTPLAKHPRANTPRQCMLVYTPPAQCMLGYPPPPAATASDGTVRILLECILVWEASRLVLFPTTIRTTKHRETERDCEK